MNKLEPGKCTFVKDEGNLFGILIALQSAEFVNAFGIKTSKALYKELRPGIMDEMPKPIQKKTLAKQ